MFLVAGGLSSLAWASPALRLLDSLLPSGAQALLPSQGWRIYTVGDSMPRFDTHSWRLRIDGLVRRERDLSYEELGRLPHAEQTSDFHCVTGWTVKNVRWVGVRFHDLLALAHPLPQARALRFVSAEHPYEDTLTLAQALRPDAMLAYAMDGQPLSRPHGAPARARLRPRRLGRPLERQRRLSGRSGASRARRHCAGLAAPARPPHRVARDDPRA